MKCPYCILYFYVGNPGPDLGRQNKCGGVKQINGIPTLTTFTQKMYVSYTKCCRNLPIFIMRNMFISLR